MNSKKKTPAAQQLIDSLLDELPLISKKKSGKGGPASSSPSTIEHGPRELIFIPDTNATGEVILEDGQRITIRDENSKFPNGSKPLGGGLSRAVPGNMQASGSAKNAAPAAGNRFPPSKPAVNSTPIQNSNSSSNFQANSSRKPVPNLPDRKQSDSQIMANFKKNVNRLSEESVVFSGELGGEGTSTMLEQAGKAAKEKLVSSEDLGDPFFQKTKSLQLSDIPTRSISSSDKSNSLHIHSVKNLEEDLGPAVDLLVEAMELTNPAFKKPERVLPKAESTPRRDLKDAPQVEDVESGEELVRRPDAEPDAEPGADSGAKKGLVDRTQVTNARSAFDAPYTSEIELNIEGDLHDDAGLPAIPEIKKFNAMPLSQHELSFSSEELAAAALDQATDAMLTHHHENESHLSSASPLASPRLYDARVIDYDLDEQNQAEDHALNLAAPTAAPIVAPTIVATVVAKAQPPDLLAAPVTSQVASPALWPIKEAIHAAQPQPKLTPASEPILKLRDDQNTSRGDDKSTSRGDDKSTSRGDDKSTSRSDDKKYDKKVLDAVAALPKLGVSKSPTPKDISLLENSRGVLDRVLAKVRGAGLEKSVNLKDAIIKRADAKPAERADKSSKENPENLLNKNFAQRPSENVTRLEDSGEERVHRSPNELAQDSREASIVSEASSERPAADLNENTMPVISAESSRANHTASVLQFPKTANSGMRWTENSSQSDIKKPHSPHAAVVLDEHTLPPIEVSKQGPLDTIDRMMATQIRPGAARAREQQDEFINQGKENPRQGKPGVGIGYGIPSFHSAEASLKQSESLRIAQTRISDLEQELERLRRENEKLASAGETLRRHSDELRARAENAEQERRESERIRDEERKVMRGQMSQKDRENIESRQRLEEAEGRLESNFKKIRVRERELEHRLEIMKMESATLVSTKDKMILELKRQMDQLVHENEYGKQKAQEAFNQYKAKQETARRVVRALRIALTILEGDDENVVPHKKAE